MFRRYDYYTEDKLLQKEIALQAVEEEIRKTPEEKLAEEEEALKASNRIISEHSFHHACTIVNPKKMAVFLRFGEELREIAEIVGAIVEISINEDSWVGKLVYQDDVILHTADSIGDQTRFVLAKILLAYEMISFDTWEGGVRFSAITELYDVAEIKDEQ